MMEDQVRNDVQIMKSSIVELKQRCARIEHKLGMPDAGARPGSSAEEQRLKFEGWDAAMKEVNARFIRLIAGRGMIPKREIEDLLRGLGR